MKSRQTKMTKRNGAVNPLQELESLRAELAAARGERSRVASAPAPLAEAEERIDAWIAACGAEWQPAVGYFASAEGGAGSFRLGLPARGIADPLRAAEAQTCALHGDSVRRALLERAEQHLAQHEPGLPEAQRAERLAQLDANLERFEREEEELVRQLEAEGAAVQRRPDAPPGILLSATVTTSGGLVDYSRPRLAHLRELARAAHAALLNVTERRDAQRLETRRLEQDLEDGKRDVRSNVLLRVNPALERQVEKQREELARLEAELAEAEATWRAARQLEDAVLQWLAAHGSDPRVPDPHLARTVYRRA